MYVKIKDLRGKMPKLVGVPTGTKLDQMFFKLVEKNGEFVKEPLGGIPALSVINIVGVPDTGKSLLVQQFVLEQVKHGRNVLFVTTESPANFVGANLIRKAKVLGIKREVVEENIAIIDATEESLRTNVRALLNTMSQAIKELKIHITVIDSITGLYEHKESTARQIVREIYNFLKKHYQTALLVSQKRSIQDSGSSESAGGLAVAHIVDGTIVLDKKVIETSWDRKLYKLPLGSTLRLIRVDGCRLCPHDTRTWVFDINDKGLIDIKVPLRDFIAEEILES